MKKIYLILFSIMVLNQINAQVTSSTFDSTWAAQFQAAIDNSLAGSGIPGVSVAIKVPGQGTFIGVGGESSAGVPVTPDMQFGIGSNTKLFTAVLILKLQELGLLSLEDHVYDWLPEFEFIDGSASIRQLLSHQAGYFDFSNDIDWTDYALVYGPDTFYTPQNTLDRIGPPHFAPGEAYSYSNTGYTIAALIIEAATGESYLDNLHQYILDPLDMDSTFLAAYENSNGTVVNGWYFGDDLGNVPLTAPYSMYWSAGSIFSTANEMVNWYDNLFHGNIINQSSLDELVAFEPSSIYGLGIDYGFFIPDNDVWAHGGWVPGYESQMGYEVKTESTICLLSNLSDDTEGLFSILVPLLIEFDFNYPRKLNDAGMIGVVSPASELCDDLIIPEVVLQNFGINSLTSVTINYQVDNVGLHTFNWTGSLSIDATQTVTLPAITASTGNHLLKCFTSNPNGDTEGYNYNNSFTSAFNINTGTILVAVNEDFEGNLFPPPGWLSGSNRIFDWGGCNLSLLSGTGCAVKNNWTDNTGRSYDLEMPLVDLSDMNNPVLSFDYAYGYYGHGYEDELEILVSEDCGENYHSIFHKSGHALKTADAPDLFYPKDNEWRLKNFNMSEYNDEVMIKFRATNHNGNNLYIDNIKLEDISDLCAAPTDLDEVQITSVSAKVSWQFHGNVQQFDVYYQPENSSEWLHKTVVGNKRWVILSNLFSGTIYNWYVTATCTSGTSSPSALDSFTTEPEQFMAKPMPSNNCLTFYPNPASDFITVDLENFQNLVELKIYEVNGTLVKSNPVSQTDEVIISISDIIPGMYLLEIRSEDYSDVQKLFISR